MEALVLSPLGPLLIFLMRIGDVSLATVRMLLIVRGRKLLAPLIGFAEVLIWIFAAGAAIRHLHSPWHILGYAGGFAVGNAVGIWLEDRLALGLASVQVFSTVHGARIADALRGRGQGVTEFTGRGRDGAVNMVYTVLQRRAIPAVLATIEEMDPEAFVTVEEPTLIQRGWMFPKRRK